MASSDVQEGLLSTFQKHIDDMRNLVLCKICIKPLYEPYTLVCGHTYCYSCLASWFGGAENRRKAKNCPDCRAHVRMQPAPNYLLRDLVHMFVSRIELLPDDETPQEHDEAKRKEAALIDTDRAAAGTGIFKGAFVHDYDHIRGLPRFTAAGAIRDYEDNVDRCPECAWELEEGMCNQCGFNEHDEDGFSDDASLEMDDDGFPFDPSFFSESEFEEDDVEEANGPQNVPPQQQANNSLAQRPATTRPFNSPWAEDEQDDAIAARPPRRPRRESSENDHLTITSEDHQGYQIADAGEEDDDDVRLPGRVPAHYRIPRSRNSSGTGGRNHGTVTSDEPDIPDVEEDGEDTDEDEEEGDDGDLSSFIDDDDNLDEGHAISRGTEHESSPMSGYSSSRRSSHEDAARARDRGNYGFSDLEESDSPTDTETESQATPIPQARNVVRVIFDDSDDDEGTSTTTNTVTTPRPARERRDRLGAQRSRRGSALHRGRGRTRPVRAR